MTTQARETFANKIALYFAVRPGEWINADRLARVGGKYAWRTRVSDCRLHHGMRIDNRQRRERFERTGLGFVISEYRYLPTEAQHAYDMERIKALPAHTFIP